VDASAKRVAREGITELIDLADHDILDIARSRTSEQEVLDLLDDPPTKVKDDVSRQF
jgi:hypothetical protein